VARSSIFFEGDEGEEQRQKALKAIRAWETTALLKAIAGMDSAHMRVWAGSVLEAVIVLLAWAR
jgi:hypothetical protein